MTTYYVRTDGGDANSGLADTAGGAKLTIQAAANLVVAADTVRVRAGTYAGFYLNCNSLVGTTTSGTPISFLADSGVVVNTRNGNASAFFQDAITVYTSSAGAKGVCHVIVDGFTVRDVLGTGTDGTSALSGVNVSRVHNVTLRNLTVFNCQSLGIGSKYSSDLTIENCVVHDTVEQHGIYPSDDPTNLIIRGCTSYNNNTSGIHINGGSGGDPGATHTATNCLVERCLVYNNGYNAGNLSPQHAGGNGIDTDGPSGCTYRNNVSYGNNNQALRLYRSDSPTAPTSCVVENNTLHSPAGQSAALRINASPASAANHVIKNNIFIAETTSTNDGPVAINGANAQAGLVSDYNQFYSARADRKVVNNDTLGAYTLTAWRALAGNDTHSVGPADGTVDPAPWSAASTFLSPSETTGGDYRLKASSPAVDAGTDLSASGFAVDLAGNARPQGAAWDMGAYEYVPPGRYLAVAAGGLYLPLLTS